MEQLTVTDMKVMRAQIMCKNDKEAVKFLNGDGLKISTRTYKRHQASLRNKAPQRLYDLAKGAKEEQMQLIDEFKLIKSELWDIYRKAASDEQIIKLRALKQITDVSPFITSAQAAIPEIIREVIENFGKDKRTDSGTSGRDTKQSSDTGSSSESQRMATVQEKSS